MRDIRRLASVAVVLVASAVLVGAWGCRRSVDPVAALIASAERAAEARDAEALAGLLAPDFTAIHGLDRASTVDQARRTLAGYESIAVDVEGVETTREESSAHVRCVAAFSGRARRVFGLEGLLPPEAVYRFDLDLVRTADGWKVQHASWEPVAPAGAAR